MRRVPSVAAILAATRRTPLACSSRHEMAMPNETVQHAPGFKAPPNVGPGRAKGQEANPYKSWEHMSHKWLILTCLGCLGAGYSAGQLAEVDETKIKPKFDRDAAMADILKSFDFRPDLAPTSLRVAFVLAARRAGLGAQNTDESCAVVAGLEDIAGVYNFIAGRHAMSTEDIAALTAVVAVKFLRGPSTQLEAEWQWGRDDKEKAKPRQVPPEGQTFHSVPSILKSVGNLSDEECVALLAVHGVGEFHPHVSGIEEAKHIPGKGFTLDNSYYRFLLKEEKNFKPIEVGKTEENKHIQPLPTTMRCVYATKASAAAAAPTTAVTAAAAGSSSSKDKTGNLVNDTKKKAPAKRYLCVVNGKELDALLKKKEWRACVETFALDEVAWEDAFQRALHKMINSNFSKLRNYAQTTADSPSPSEGEAD